VPVARPGRDLLTESTAGILKKLLQYLVPKAGAGTRSSLGTGSGERENRLALQDRLQNRLLRYPIFLLSRASILLQSKASTSSADFCAFSVALRGHGHSTAQLRRVLVMLETTPVLIDLPCPKEDEFCHHSAEVILVLPNAAV